MLHEKRGNNNLYYSYDENGNLAIICYNNVNYYVTTNMRGDVEAVYNASGQLQARYVYDSWGKVEKVLNASNTEITDTNHIGHINPIRYRGYYYDTETGFYYLQSRYYNPEVGRFINSDFQINSDIFGNNLYVYCRNNPINYEDDEGTSWTALFAIKVAFDIVCDIVVTSAIKEATGEEYTALDLCATVVSSVVGSIFPWETTLCQGLFAGVVDIVSYTLQNESFLDSIISASLSLVERISWRRVRVN